MKTENEEKKAKDQADIFKKSGRKKAARDNTETRIVRVPVFSETKVATAEDIGESEQIDVRLPRRATVFNKQGIEQGTFVKEETNVFVYSGESRTGYVDKNDNVLSLTNKYIATLRRPERYWILALVLILVLVTLLTVILSVYFLTRSENTAYAPVIFIASEDGLNWEDTEDLPIFFNEMFGDNKVVPGMKGSYRFIFENRNKNTLDYSLLFSEENEYGIAILYRLKRDGAYISGTQDYVSADELGMDGLTVEARSSTMFELEWFWQDNDEADTIAGQNSAVYTLNISLSAQVSVRA